MRQSCSQDLLDLVRFEVERTHPTFINDAAVGADDVESLRPRRVARHRRVVDIVEQRFRFDIHLIDESTCELPAFFGGRGLGVDDTTLLVGLHLPLVVRVGFFDIHDDEVRDVVVLLFQLFDLCQPGTKWRSRVATEHQHEWFVGVEIRDAAHLPTLGGK